MRVKRRATLTTLAVVALLAATVGTATAKKPNKPKPPSAVPIAVSMDAEPWWVHEDADRIRYTVTLENKTSAAIEDVYVEFTAAEVTDPLFDIGTIDANDSTAIEFERYVSQFSEEEKCDIGAECALSAYVVVSVVVDGEETVITQTEMSTPLMPDPPCNFVYERAEEPGGTWVIDVAAPVEVDDLCIWTLPVWGDAPTAGVWEITLSPIPSETRPKRPMSATVDVRDGVPGNWCTQWIGTSSRFGGTWRTEDPDIVGQVYLPGDENMPSLGDGMCLGGGQGGDYFAVGNPKSFYLRADGYVTVRWVSEVPGDPPTDN